MFTEISSIFAIVICNKKAIYIMVMMKEQRKIAKGFFAGLGGMLFCLIIFVFVGKLSWEDLL